MSSNIIEKGTHLKTSIRLKFIISAILLLILALGFNALLSLHSLEKLYVESIASQYSAVGKDLQRNLENKLRFGKTIEKFFGIEDILKETKQNILRKISMGTISQNAAVEKLTENDISVSIVLPNGTILYSTDKEFVGTTLPQEAMMDYSDRGEKKSSSKKYSYTKYQTRYFTSLPVQDRGNTWVASAVIIFDQKQVKALLNNVRDQNIKEISLILLLSILVMLFLFSRINAEDHQLKHWKLRVSLVMFFVIIVAQLVFSGLNVNTFKNYYLQINRQKTEMLTTLLKEDIEFYLSKGIKINKLLKMDVTMGEIIEASPELNDITILDGEENPLYLATKKGVIDFQHATEEQSKRAKEMMLTAPDPDYNIRLEIVNEKSTVKGYISANMSAKGYVSTNISKEVLFSTLFEIGLDSGTVLIISILFFGELLILIFVYIEQQITENQLQVPVHYSAIRPAAFLFLFGVDISVSFLPLYMEKLYEPIFGLSKDIVMGLPISVRMFFTGISFFIAGIWIDRRGWHEPFISGLVMTGGGILYSWLAPDAVQFIISRAIFGLGYGFALMAAQGFVITYTDEKSKAQGLSQLFAGVWAGSICGGAAGAMLADRIGYSPVFFIGSVIIFSIVFYIIFFMRKAIRKPETHSGQAIEPTAKSGKVFRFIFNRNVFSLILLSSIPAAIAVIGLLNYFSPIYLNRIGESQSNIGRIFMIYGVSLIYIAPFLSKYVDTSNNKKVFIVISGLLGSVAFLTFYLFEGLLASAIAILILGISSSFGSSRRAYILKLRVAQDIGPGKAMGIFNSALRIGQVLGPISVGWLVAVMGVNKGITYLGLAYLLATILFFLFAQSDQKLNLADSVEK